MPIQQPCLADIEPLFSPLTAMRIANPIYDSVFKFLMENELIARGLIGRLIGLEIVELTPQPQEVTERKAARLGDDQSTLRVFRLDFSAVVRSKDGELHKVLIELQKAGRSEAVSRFRNYLARHYAVPPTATSVLPIIAIYLLGFTLADELPKVVRVKRRYLDAVTGEPVAAARPVEFIEMLTHDAVVVQIPKIDAATGTELERGLQVFNQHYASDASSHFLSVPAALEALNDPLLSASLRTLLVAAADEETVKQMSVEDEVTHMFDDLDAVKLLAAEERRQKEEERRQKEEERRQKEDALREKAEALREKDEALREKDEALARLRELEAKLNEKPS